MNIVKGIVTELRERRLWPVAVALLVGLVAVPVVLTKSPSTSKSSQTPAAGSSSSAGHSLSVKLADSAAQPGLRGGAHDPFHQQGGGTIPRLPFATTSASAPVPGVGATAALGAGSGGSASFGSSAGGSATFGGSSVTSSGAGGSSPAPAPSTPAPSVSKSPAPAGLTPTETYDVAISINNASGGLDLQDPSERLSPIPSASQPLLVELGVAQGGRSVLFAVRPGTVPSGPGSCTPGPIDCEILSLGVNQTESVSAQGASGAPARFAVVGITAVKHPSVAAANKARNTASSVGADLLKASPLPALSLFQYEPSVGAVVDLRDLTVGGN